MLESNNALEISRLRAAKVLGIRPEAMNRLAAQRQLQTRSQGQKHFLLMSDVLSLLDDEWVKVHRGEAPDSWLLTAQAATELNVTQAFVYALTRSGTLRQRTIGRFVLVALDDVRSYAQKRGKQNKPVFKRAGYVTGREAAEFFGITYKWFTKQFLETGILKPEVIKRRLYFRQEEIEHCLNTPAAERFLAPLPEGYCAQQEAAQFLGESQENLAKLVAQFAVPHVVHRHQICPKRSELPRLRRRIDRARALRKGERFGRLWPLAAIRKDLRAPEWIVRRMVRLGFLRTRTILKMAIFWAPSREARIQAQNFITSAKLTRTRFRKGVFTPKQFRKAYKLSEAEWNEIRATGWLEIQKIGSKLFYRLPSTSAEKKILELRRTLWVIHKGCWDGWMNSKVLRSRYRLTTAQEETIQRHSIVRFQKFGKFTIYEVPNAEIERQLRNLGKSRNAPLGYLSSEAFKRRYGLSAEQMGRLVADGALRVQKLHRRIFVKLPKDRAVVHQLGELAQRNGVVTNGPPDGWISRKQLLEILGITPRRLEDFAREGLVTRKKFGRVHGFLPPTEAAREHAATLRRSAEAQNGLRPSGFRSPNDVARAATVSIATVRAAQRRLRLPLERVGRFWSIPEASYKALVYVCIYRVQLGLRRELDLIESAQIIGSQISVMMHEERGHLRQIRMSRSGDSYYLALDVLLLKYRRETGQVPKVEEEAGELSQAQALIRVGLLPVVFEAELRSNMYRLSPSPSKPFYAAEIKWRNQQLRD